MAETSPEPNLRWRRLFIALLILLLSALILNARRVLLASRIWFLFLETFPLVVGSLGLRRRSLVAVIRLMYLIGSFLLLFSAIPAARPVRGKGNVNKGLCLLSPLSSPE